jgi:hypothetical protein
MKAKFAVQFYLNAPAPRDLVTDYEWTDANLQIIGSPSLNYISNVSAEKQTFDKPVMLSNPAEAWSSDKDSLILDHSALQNIIIQYGVGRIEDNSNYYGLSGNILKMYAYVLSLPPEYYEALKQAKTGDTFCFYVSVDRKADLKIDIYHKDKQIICDFPTPDSVRLSKLQGIVKKAVAVHNYQGKINSSCPQPGFITYKSSDLFKQLFFHTDGKSAPFLKELQLKYKAPKETSLPSKELALRRAASKGADKDVSHLISDYGAEVNSKSSNGFTALDWAYFGSHMSTVNTLCWLGADQTNLKPMLWKYVLDNEAEWPVKEIALQRAGQAGNIKDVKLLVSRYEAGNCEMLKKLAEQPGLNAEMLSLLEELIAQQQAVIVQGMH